MVGPGTQLPPPTYSIHNMKRIVIALHNHHDAYTAFPAGYSVNQGGEPLLSWRVHILPFAGQEALYRRFNLREPWDSPQNQALIAQMPDVFRSPGSKAEPGKTVYLGNASPKGIFGPPQDAQRPLGTRMRDIRDGSSNTLAVVEVGDALAVEWTKPADFIPDANDPIKGLGLIPGQFAGAFCDGSTQFISTANRDGEQMSTFKALFTKDGGEVLTGQF